MQGFPSLSRGCDSKLRILLLQAGSHISRKIPATHLCRNRQCGNIVVRVVRVLVFVFFHMFVVAQVQAPAVSFPKECFSFCIESTTSKPAHAV